MVTRSSGRHIRDGSILREDLCDNIPGQAVIKRLAVGPGLQMDSSGADDGTGDVIISLEDRGMFKQYIHEQLVPAAIWQLTHEFNGYPEAVIIDVNGERLYGDLTYPTPNLTIATFGTPIAGKAALTITKTTQTSFQQSTPSATWTVTHDLGRYPDVITFDTSDGRLRIYGDTIYDSEDALTIIFANPVSGELYLV